jgi:FKBP-type peptidyl-prolyl cis-trans isomerase
MKIINITTSIILISSLFIVVKGQDKKTAQGLSYKIFTDNSGEKIKVNDVITFNFTQKTEKDSVLFSSYQAGRPVKIQVQPSKNLSDLMDFFTLLSVKDSAMVKVPTDSIFKTSESERPAFLPKGSALFFSIKIENVQSMDAAIAEEKQKAEKLQLDEKSSLAKYLADKHLIDAKTTASGLKYLVVKPSVKRKPLAGDTVVVNYTGRTIEGKVFDSSIEAEAKKAGLDQPGRTYEPIDFVVGQGQVIKGWDEGLLLLNEGSKAQFIIPSDLAYGPRGAGEDIKPYSSLVFDVELIKVKPAKRATVAPAKKAPAKAPAKKAKAPVKKPSALKKH